MKVGNAEYTLLSRLLTLFYTATSLINHILTTTLTTTPMHTGA